MKDISSEEISRIKRSSFNFIWNKKQDKIKRDREMSCVKTMSMEDCELLIETFRQIFAASLDLKAIYI